MIEIEKKNVTHWYHSVIVPTTTVALTCGGSLLASANSNVEVDFGVGYEN